MRKINRTYKFRLYPTKAQTELLEKHFGCTRFVYNYFLNQRQEQYRLTGNNDNYHAQSETLTKLKKQEETAWLKEVNSQSLQYALRCLDVAYANFFKKRAKYPKFKSKHSKNSFTAPQFTSIEGNRLFIVKFKEGIKCRVHREIKGKIGKVTITKTPSGKYFASVLTEEEYVTPLEKTNKSVGVDLGLKDLLVTSDGEVFSNNRYTKKYERKLATAQRHLSRKKKGSRGYENQRLKVARIYEKISNSRADYLHKCSISLVRKYDIICIEDLNVKGMVRNHHLAKSISDASWYSFVSMLTYKAEWNDKKVVKINRFFPSSQTCNVCRYVNKDVKDLSVREWECPICHTHHNRDVNAAINILRVGLKQYTSAGTADYTGGEEVRAVLSESHSSVKPEARKQSACGSPTDAHRHVYNQMVICDAEDRTEGRKGLILEDTILVDESGRSHRTGLRFKGKYDLYYTLSFRDENYNANEDFDFLGGLSAQIIKLSEPLVLDFKYGYSPITLHSNGILEIKSNDGRVIKHFMQIPEGFGKSYSMTLLNDNGDFIWNDVFEMED